MILDLNYIIFSSLIIACLLLLYIYKEKIFKIKSKDNEAFSLFLKDLKFYMLQHHPKIDIDYRIVEKTKNEEDMELRQTLIIESVIKQFFNFPYQNETQASIPREKLWINYEEKSKSNPKYPSDWALRKEFAWKRDNKNCNRCGNEINIDEAYTSFVKEINDGGGYNLENIMTLCVNCNKIVNSKNPNTTISSLDLNDKLMNFIK
ncbi:MAG: HNH endonuclease signature motif containing protein [Aliarcobacter sp.]|nr:HNH endonuclease signature motif containing protein [Aliarcobacter sp.]